MWETETSALQFSGQTREGIQTPHMEAPEVDSFLQAQQAVFSGTASGGPAQMLWEYEKWTNPNLRSLLFYLLI